MIKRALIFLLGSFVTLMVSSAFGESLTVSYFERPPYYFTALNGSAQGFLIDRTREILKTAQIEAQFLPLSPTQILYIVQHANTPNCSVGWFKKPERELYAQFTRPIYQNQPLVLLIHRDQQERFERFSDLATIFKTEKLVMARMSSFSYGTYVDRLLERFNPTSFFASKAQLDLLKAIADGTADYLLIAPEEVDELIRRSGFDSDNFRIKRLDELPAGNLRYLMCNRAVKKAVMDRINQAIAGWIQVE